MPTPEHAPSVTIIQKIMDSALELVPQAGWTSDVFEKACLEQEVTPEAIAYALPEGIRSLVPAYFELLKFELEETLSELPLDEMRIRDKVSQGVEIWLTALSRVQPASVKALDWCTVRPTGPLSITEVIWAVADAIWLGIGDTSEGFTYYSKRTSLSGVITTTLAVWRKSEGDEAEWKPFLERRIENVMQFEAFKAKFKRPEIALPF